MTRRALLALAVTVLVATAGCAGLFGGGGSGDDTTTTTSPTTTTSTTATPTVTSTTPAGGTETPSPLAGQAETHREQLRSAGSFTSTITLNVTRGSRSQNARVVYRIDTENDRYYRQVALTQGGTTATGATYTAGDKTYTKRSTGDRTRYGVDTEPYEGRVQNVSVTDAMGGSRFGVDMAKYDLERSGTATFQGEEMTRYTASGPEAMDTQTPQGVEEITAFEVTILVDDRGIVRRISMHIEGRTAQGGKFVQDARIEITDVGATTVTEPDWTDEAEQGSN